MTTGSVLVVIAVVAVVISTLAVLRLRRRGSHGHDDTVRAGTDQELDGKDAALRSMGRNAWMRGGSGGA